MAKTIKLRSKKWLKPFGTVPSFVLYLIAILVIAIAFAVIITRTALGRYNSARIRVLFAHMSFLLIMVHVPIFFRLVAKWRMPIFIDAYILFASFGHAAGHILGFYNAGWHWDKILHFFAGVFFTLIGFSFVLLLSRNRNLTRSKQISPIFIIVFAVAFSLAIAALWEIFEFSVDSITGHNAQRWQDAPSTYYFQGSGLIDTMLDFVFHLIGTISATIIGSIWVVKKPDDVRLFILRTKDIQSINAELEKQAVADQGKKITQEKHEE